MEVQKEKTAAVVLAFPLYVDGIPAHLLSCLVQMEEAQIEKRQPASVYGIVNCGFYEGIQAEPALEVLQNWCMKAGFLWAGGIGVGGGGSLEKMPDVKPGHGPKAPIEKELEKLAEKISKKENYESQYISVAFPRFLYKMAAQMGWRQLIRGNGGKARDLGKKPME